MLTDLSVTPFADTIRRLASERRSGDLQVRSGKLVKTVFFDHGRIVFAASNLKKDRLGEALVALGRITDADFQRASALMKDGDRRRRFGDALVQAGLMDKNEVGRSVARQVKRVVVSLFDLNQGAAFFEERRCVIPLEYMVSLSVHRLLYMGIKTMKSRELTLTGLGALDRWVALATVPPFRFGLRKCGSEELDILEQAKRRVTIRKLAWAPGGMAFPRLRSAYALLASGILEDATEAKIKAAPQPAVQMETGTFLLSVLRTRPDPTGREAIRQEVLAELEHSARLDRDAWLRVSRTAPKEELVRALEEKMERYHALLEAVGEDADLKTDIELILGRASSMLRLARQSRMPGPPASSGVAAGPATAVPASPEAPAPPAEATSAGGFTGDAAVEHLLMEAEVRMTVSDYPNAVKVYRKLVELVPDAPSYRVRMAIAMACYPPTAKQAEREFLEAARLAPNDAGLHYQFALYYKAMKAKSRAIAELQTAVRLNPRHRPAREELEALSPKDSALTNLKRLFK